MNTRLPYLSAHLRTLNHSIKEERRRFWFLFPIACLSVGFGTGFILGHEKAYRDLTTIDPGYVHSEAVKRAPVSTPHQTKATPSHGVTLEWRGSTRSGESIRENERQGLNFVF